MSLGCSTEYSRRVFLAIRYEALCMPFMRLSHGPVKNWTIPLNPAEWYPDMPSMIQVQHPGKTARFLPGHMHTKLALHYPVWTGLMNRIHFVGDIRPHTSICAMHAAAPEGRPGGGCE